MELWHRRPRLRRLIGLLAEAGHKKQTTSHFKFIKKIRGGVAVLNRHLQGNHQKYLKIKGSKVTKKVLKKKEPPLIKKKGKRCSELLGKLPKIS